MALGKVIKPPTRPPKGQRKPKAEGAAPGAAAAAPAGAAPAAASAAPAVASPVVAARPQAPLPTNGGGPRPGRKPTGEAEDDRILTWPDLVYTELLCMAVLTAVMLVICWFARAPLEEIANPNHTPNPSKAPWYFVGLQEMLVYFDPWIAGVVLPTTIIVGLMAIPYVDRNPTKGSGYYNWGTRKFAWSFFVAGFTAWCVLIVIGNGVRGPGWAWYWPVIENQHHVKVVIEGQTHHFHFGQPGKPSGRFWDALHFDHLPALGKVGQKREEDGSVGRLGICLPGIFMFLTYCGAMFLLPAKWNPHYFSELWRRRPKYLGLTAIGLLLVFLPKIGDTFGVPLPAYIGALFAAAGAVLIVQYPLRLAAEKQFFPILGRGQLSPFYKDLGLIRYVVTMAIVLQAVGLPAKMFCRLVLPWHLKYVVVTPWFYI